MSADGTAGDLRAGNMFLKLLAYAGGPVIAALVLLFLVSCQSNPKSGTNAAKAPQNDRSPLPTQQFQCDQPFPEASKLPPLARQQLGIALQTGAAVRDLLGSGRDSFWKAYGEGGSEAALRGVRERAALYSITCGPADLVVRSGVCLNYGLMCASHGGGYCEICLRTWAAQVCAEQFRDHEQWDALIDAAKLMGIPGFVEHLEKEKARLIDDPSRTACFAAF